MEGPVIARVEPLTQSRAVRGPFDYRIRPDHREAVQVGSVLRVPFGRRRALGVVLELSEHSEVEPERLVEPESVLPSALPADLVALAQWMADRYCSTTARALSLLLAPGAAAGVKGREMLVASLSDEGLAALADGATLTDRQRDALHRLEREGETPAVQLGTDALRRLEKRGLVTMRRRVVGRRSARPPVAAASVSAPQLTTQQVRALEQILEALSCGGGFLLHGVTGSGKTEVYLRAVEAALAAGRGAIVLVPEIALTPQTLQRFEARFGDIVAVMHSGLSQGERHDEWLRLRSGRARVCVGPRSAVFAPLEDIGLIVVDEEHDASYKHEGDPRYDARTVALRRAQDHRAVLVAGSATPRPESMLALSRLRLQTRVDGRPLPRVEILDLRGLHHPLHPQTRMALADLRRAGGKGIVLLNRRGWSNFLSCRSCGAVWMCPHCEVALVLHRGRQLLACHHCGHREPVPSRCRSCSSVAIARHGAGTERLEHELAAALGEPGFPVMRLDADAHGERARARTLAAFGAAEAGLLVGTQMVAKGHDFPDVALGVVLDADQTLRFPDFRAEERTFALITQLAGRTGRAGSAGRVLVQTLAPDARSIRFAAHHDSEGFLADELVRRQALAYPPYASLIRVVCAAEDAGHAQAIASDLSARVAVPGATVLGPAPLFRLRNRFRSQIVIKATGPEQAIEAVREAVDQLAVQASRQGVSLSVDVDPQ
jgi:primosomal protein N' (replication factor Y)